MRGVLLVLLVALLPLTADAQPVRPQFGGTGCEQTDTLAVSDLTTFGVDDGSICTVFDGATTDDCTVGGGSETVTCLFVGPTSTDWIPLPGGQPFITVHSEDAVRVTGLSYTLANTPRATGADGTEQANCSHNGYTLQRVPSAPGPNTTEFAITTNAVVLGLSAAVTDDIVCTYEYE